VDLESNSENAMDMNMLSYPCVFSHWSTKKLSIDGVGMVDILKNAGKRYVG
jgi:hypothetical protein